MSLCPPVRSPSGLAGVIFLSRHSSAHVHRNRPMPNPVSVGAQIPPNGERIEVHVSELRQLFNPIDPSPPREKDLDSRAEEFIVAWARAAKRDAQLALQIDIDAAGRPDEAATV